jgi:hypothetical protein
VLLAAFCSITTLVDLVAKPSSTLWTAARLVGTGLLLVVLAAWAAATLARQRRERHQR